MADVFISYHEQSAGELAQQIADALNAAGISSWCARRDLPPGSNFARDIPPQIDACRVFLLILNNNVYQSLHMENELGMAFERLRNREAITILPFETESVTRKEWLRYYLFHIQNVNIPPSDPQRVEKLIQQIARILSVTPRKPEASPMRQPVPTPPQGVQPQSWQPQPAQLSPQPAQPSANILLSGPCGECVNYTLDDKGVLTVSGYGPMRNYKWDSATFTTTAPWHYKRDEISEIRVQKGVTSIGDWAFSDCFHATSVEISHSVNFIGIAAFSRCDNLQYVFIPDSVTFIGYKAFDACYQLRNVSVPVELIIAKDIFPESAHITRRE